MFVLNTDFIHMITLFKQEVIIVSFCRFETQRKVDVTIWLSNVKVVEIHVTLKYGLSALLSIIQ